MESTQRKTAAPSNEPDAKLLRLNAEYRALIAEQNAGKHRGASGDVTDESMERLSAIERKIADTPAESYAGVGVKLLIGVDNLDPLDPGKTRTTDELNLESALADAERLAGEGIINSAQPKTAASDSELDAPLLRTDANYTALLAKCNAGESSPNGDVSDLDQECLTGLEEAIAAYPVHTLAGVAAKLHVVRAFIGREVPVRADERCAYAALEAVERLLDGPTTVAPVTAGEDPFEALAAEWAEQKAECERLAKAEEEAGVTGPDFPSDAAQERLGEIEKRIAVTPTTTILGIATKLRAEVFAEVEYEFTTTENVIKTALAGAEHLLAQSQEADAELLALGARIINEQADWKAGKVKDDEAEEHGERVSDMEQRFAEMPAHTLSGVVAKLRHLRHLLVDDGTVRSSDIVLVETALAAVEQANRAGGNPAARSPTQQ